MADELEGGCQCGTVRYRISGAPIMTALCHCTLCRRANAAPAVAWAMYEDAQVTFPNCRAMRSSLRPSKLGTREKGERI